MTDVDPTPSTPADRAFAIAWGVMLSLCVTGYTFGQSNHHVYLLDALRFGHPELLARDWFTTHTLQYHFLFTLLTVALQKVGLLMAGFFTLYLGLVVAMHMAWLSIVRSIGGNLRVYLLSVLIYHLSGGGLGLGVYQFLQDGSFLPSNIAAVAALAAMAFWLSGRLLPTAICVGIAGLFHVNYAMALIPAWAGLSLLASVRERSVRGWFTPGALVATVIAMTPCIYNVAVAAWAATQQSASIPIAEFVAVYVRLRHSHHHEPLAWPAALWISFLWPMPFAFFALVKLPPSRAKTGIAVILMTVLGAVAFAFIFAGIWYVSETIVKISLFRFSPFAKLLSCVLTAWLFIVHWPRGRPGLVPAYLLIAISLFVTALFRGHWPASVPQPSAGLLIGAGLATLALAYEMAFDPLARPRPFGSGFHLLWLPMAFAGAIFVCVSFAARQRLGVAMPGEGDAEMAELCQWAQQSTPADALFLAPPQDQSFTLAARRAEVVSFKHVPQLSAELVEWKRRLDDVLDMDVIGLPTPLPRTLDAIAARYASLPAEHLQKVACEYGCDYIIAMRDLGRPAEHVTPGQRYFVYRTAK